MLSDELSLSGTSVLMVLIALAIYPSIHPIYSSLIPSIHSSHPSIQRWLSGSVLRLKELLVGFVILWTRVAADNLISLLSDWLILNTSAWPDRFTILPHHFRGPCNSVVFWMKFLNDSLHSNFDFKVHCNCRVPSTLCFFAYKFFTKRILSGL